MHARRLRPKTADRAVETAPAHPAETIPARVRSAASMAGEYADPQQIRRKWSNRPELENISPGATRMPSRSAASKSVTRMRVSCAMPRASATRLESGASSARDFSGLPGETSHHTRSSPSRFSAVSTASWTEGCPDCRCQPELDDHQPVEHRRGQHHQRADRGLHGAPGPRRRG